MVVVVEYQPQAAINKPVSPCCYSVAGNLRVLQNQLALFFDRRHALTRQYRLLPLGENDAMQK